MPRLPLRPLALLSFAAVCVALPVRSQDPPPQQIPESIQVKVNLVLLPTRVTTMHGKPGGRLKREDFRIYENGREQPVAFFAPVDSPADIALLMDVSGSTSPHLAMLKQAAKGFMSRFGADNQIALYTLGRDVLRAHPFSDDRDSLRRAIDNLRTEADVVPIWKVPHGEAVLKSGGLRASTLLYDGLALVQKDFPKRERRRIILVFTDGWDLGSAHSIETLNALALQGSATIFAVMSEGVYSELSGRVAQLGRPAVIEKRKKDKATGLPRGSVANKPWLVVMDLSGSLAAASINKVQSTTREFLRALSPQARVWLFDYRQQLRPLVFPAAGDAPVEMRPLTPAEAEQLLPLAGNTTWFPQLGENGAPPVEVHKTLVVGDSEHSGLARLMISIAKSPLSIGVLHPDDPLDPQRRKEVIQRLVHDPNGTAFVSWPEVGGILRRWESDFEETVRDTGGQFFRVRSANELKDVYAEIAAQIRSSYTLGYYTNAGPGRHELEVKIPSRPMNVHSRRALVVPE